MGRPNFDYMARQQRDIASYVGEVATLRRYVSADAIAPSSLAAGGGAAYYYSMRAVTALMVPVSFDEIGQAGGLLLAGDMRATFIDTLPSPEDEILWRGVNYRVVSDPVPQAIVGSSAMRFILRRGQPTGG